MTFNFAPKITRISHMLCFGAKYYIALWSANNIILYGLFSALFFALFLIVYYGIFIDKLWDAIFFIAFLCYILFILIIISIFAIKYYQKCINCSKIIFYNNASYFFACFYFSRDSYFFELML